MKNNKDILENGLYDITNSEWVKVGDLSDIADAPEEYTTEDIEEYVIEDLDESESESSDTADDLEFLQQYSKVELVWYALKYLFTYSRYGAILKAIIITIALVATVLIVKTLYDSNANHISDEYNTLVSTKNTSKLNYILVQDEDSSKGLDLQVQLNNSATVSVDDFASSGNKPKVDLDGDIKPSPTSSIPDPTVSTTPAPSAAPIVGDDALKDALAKISNENGTSYEGFLCVIGIVYNRCMSNYGEFTADKVLAEVSAPNQFTAYIPGRTYADLDGVGHSAAKRAIDAFLAGTRPSITNDNSYKRFVGSSGFYIEAPRGQVFYVTDKAPASAYNFFNNNGGVHAMKKKGYTEGKYGIKIADGGTIYTNLLNVVGEDDWGHYYEVR